MKRLRRHIAQDPEAFFDLSDTDSSGDLDFKEWVDACRASAGEMEESVLRSLFDQLDADKSGTISLEEFTETRNVVRNFVKEAMIEPIVVEVVTEMLYDMRCRDANNTTEYGPQVIYYLFSTSEKKYGFNECIHGLVGVLVSHKMTGRGRCVGLIVGNIMETINNCSNYYDKIGA